MEKLPGRRPCMVPLPQDDRTRLLLVLVAERGVLPTLLATQMREREKVVLRLL